MAGAAMDILLTTLVTGIVFDALFQLLAAGAALDSLYGSLTGLLGTMMQNCVCVFHENVWTVFANDIN